MEPWQWQIFRDLKASLLTITGRDSPSDLCVFHRSFCAKKVFSRICIFDHDGIQEKYDYIYINVSFCTLYNTFITLYMYIYILFMVAVAPPRPTSGRGFIFQVLTQSKNTVNITILWTCDISNYLKFKKCFKQTLKNAKPKSGSPFLHLANTFEPHLQAFWCSPSKSTQKKAKLIKPARIGSVSLHLKPSQNLRRPKIPREKVHKTCTCPGFLRIPISFGIIRQALSVFLFTLSISHLGLCMNCALCSLKPLEILVMSRFCCIQAIV